MAVFFIGPIVANAQAASNGEYANLFSPFDNSYNSVVGLSGSGIYSTGAVTTSSSTSDTTSTKGFGFDISLVFQTSAAHDATWYWNHISLASGNFVIRACETSGAQNCWINTIPFNAISVNPFDPVASKGKDNVIIATDPTNAAKSTLLKAVETVGSGGTNLIAGLAMPKNYVVVPAQEVILKAFNGDSGELYHYDSSSKSWVDWGSGSSVQQISFQPGETLNVDLWYLSKGYTASAGDTNTRTFPNVGSGTYFPISDPIAVTVPADATTANAQNTATNNAIASSSAANSPTNALTGQNNNPAFNLLSCGFGHYASLVPGDGTINGCAAYLSLGIYNLTSWVAGLFGKLFDYFIGYSLSDASYRYSFAVTGWQLVRDISNIFFILIMVWTGLSAVFDTSKTSMKRVIPALIINALLINFSLFATRIIIDISNVTARVFYSEMVVCKQTEIDAGGCQSSTEKDFAGYPSLSEKILSSFNPQRIMQQGVLQAPTYSNGTSTVSSASNDPIAYSNYITLVSLVAAAIMVVVGIMFFKVSFLFLGRVVGLYICMIFSPFAFLSRDMPLFGGVARLRWGDWLKELTNYAMLAPVFVFFLYIIYILLTSNFAQQMGVSALSSGGFFEITLSIVIPMLIIFGLMTAAQRAAQSLSGEIGKTIQKYGEQLTGAVAGTAVGLATGGTGLLARNTIGRGLRAYGNREIEVRNADGTITKTTRAAQLAQLAPTSWTARQQNKLLNLAQTSSFNVGNASVKIGGKDYSVSQGVKSGLGAFGLKTNNLLQKNQLVGEGAGKGGIIAVDKKRAEERKKQLDNRIKLDHLSDDQAKAVWEKYKKDAVEKAAETSWKEDEHIDKMDSVKKAADEYKAIEKREEDLEKKKADIEKNLIEAQRTGNAAQVATLTRDKEDNAAALAAAATEKGTAKGTLDSLRTAAIADLKKNNVPKDSEAYKSAAAAEKKRLDEYGKVADVKRLEGAMRAEYAEDLRADSFWMKDGKPRYWTGPMGVAAAAALSVLLPGIGLAIGTALLGEIGSGWALDVGDIHGKATKNMITTFKKAQGKGNRETRLSLQMDKVNDLITKAVETLGAEKPSGKIDDWSDDIIQKGIITMTIGQEDTIDALKKQIKSELDEVKKRQMKFQLKEEQKLLKDLNKAIAERKSLQNQLDQVRDTVKKDEESKKEKEAAKKTS
ncbi:MAG TPA: hypothetical protein VL576_03785 [Candidatus Paceibacterota bacterium]|nr:hypothetical protein [Candidatus Paceibacterota bacterium]